MQIDAEWIGEFRSGWLGCSLLTITKSEIRYSTQARPGLQRRRAHGGLVHARGVAEAAHGLDLARRHRRPAGRLEVELLHLAPKPRVF